MLSSSLSVNIPPHAPGGDSEEGITLPYGSPSAGASAMREQRRKTSLGEGFVMTQEPPNEFSVHFEHLPDAVIHNIVSFLPLDSVLACELVSKEWLRVMRDDGVWLSLSLEGVRPSLAAKVTDAAIMSLLGRPCARSPDGEHSVTSINLTGCTEITEGGIISLLTRCARLSELTTTGSTPLSWPALSLALEANGPRRRPLERLTADVRIQCEDRTQASHRRACEELAAFLPHLRRPPPPATRDAPLSCALRVSELDISGGWMRAGDLRGLAAALPGCQIAKLSIRNSRSVVDFGRDYSGAARLADAIGSSPSLTSVDLRGCALGCTQQQYLASFSWYCDSCFTLDSQQRYRCTQCDDFDYCHNCHGMHSHSHPHPMVLVNEPVLPRLAESLRNNRVLREICLSDCNLGRSGSVQLAQAVGCNRGLTHVDVSDNVVGPAGARAFADAVRASPTLRTLDLSKTDVGGEGAAALFDGLGDSAGLEELVLRNCGLRMHDEPEGVLPGEGEGDGDGEGEEDQGRRTTRAGAWGVEGEGGASGTAEPPPHPSPPRSAARWATARPPPPPRHHPHTEGAPGRRARPGLLAAAAMASDLLEDAPPAPTPEWQDPAAAFARGVARSRTLRSLDLRGNAFGLRGGRAIAAAFSADGSSEPGLLPSLETLRLSSGPIPVRGLLADEVRELDLSHQGLRAEDGVVLGALLRRNASVTSLRLGANFLSWTDAAGSSYRRVHTAQGVSALSRALRARPGTLRELSLRDNSIGAPGLRALAAALRGGGAQFGRGLALDLSGNLLVASAVDEFGMHGEHDVTGVEALAEAMAHADTYIASLCMAGHPSWRMGKAGAEALAPGVRYSPHLRSLCLDAQ